MTSHDALQESIPDYLAGRLEEGERDRLERHLEDCEDCAAMAGTWAEIVGGLRDGGAELLSPHPEPTELRDHARSGEASAELRDHLQTCATCAIEVDAWRRWLSESRQAAPAPRRRSFLSSVLPVAAGLLVGALLTTLAMQGLRTDPGGATPLLILEPPLRGAATSGTVRLSPERPYVLLGLSPPRSAASDALRVSLRPVERPGAWSAPLTAGEVEAARSGAGIVTVLVPSSVLSPGPWVLEWRSGEVLLSELPFDVVDD